MNPAGFSQAILDYQSALPGLGISYSGPTDGIGNPQFTSAMLALEMKEEIDTGIPAVGHIYSGGTVLMPLSKMLQLYRKDKAAKDTKDQKPSVQTADASTTAWQKALSAGMPIVGSLYKGPVDGVVNPELISAANQIESTIQSKLKNQSVKGKIFDGVRFLTSPDDVRNALSILAG